MAFSISPYRQDGSRKSVEDLRAQIAENERYLAGEKRFTELDIRTARFEEARDALRQPHRQSQALTNVDESDYDYLRDRSAPNGWLPEDLQRDTARKMRALSDRRIPFAQVCPHSTPDEVVDAMSSLMLVDVMQRDASSRGRRLDSLMDPSTEL